MHKLLRTVIALALAGGYVLFALPAGVTASNDQRFGEQWGLHKIGAEPAWSAARGDGVLIAFIDSGVDMSHPDLNGKIAAAQSFLAGDASPQDQHGHGTLTAGIAAAETGNGQGIAGVAPGARILAARAFDGAGNGASNNVAAGIDWAVAEAGRRGSKLVLNLSFVGPGGSLLLVDDVRASIEAATSRGAAVVAAAGNDGGASQYTAPPGSGILVVGAHTREDSCSRFSNYGSGVDLLAPGGAGGRSSATDILSTYLNSSYASSSGTSLATPFVSGAMALLMSKGMGAAAAADKLVATARGPVVSCRGEGSSYGFLDVAAALGVSGAPAPPPAPATLSAAPAEPLPQSAPARRPRAAARPAPAPAPAPPPAPAPEPSTILLSAPPVKAEQQGPPEAPMAASLELPPKKSSSDPVSPVRIAAGSLFLAVAAASAILRFIFRPTM